MEFSRQEYWSGVFPSVGYLPDPETEPMSLTSALAGMVFTTRATWEAQLLCIEDTMVANANMFSWVQFGRMI